MTVATVTVKLSDPDTRQFVGLATVPTVATVFPDKRSRRANMAAHTGFGSQLSGRTASISQVIVLKGEFARDSWRQLDDSYDRCEANHNEAKTNYEARGFASFQRSS